ncbi:hypothetical protein CAEBREN_22956 [Caenorhabditis brenneri]|uniref:Uncharacterized protein n=1 Tax=Caenorhabditis brenneri TaxID=135651 RepID=G0PK08_CAEBE|nr:hypothetical protein CAEBREN_22956 [Caenorhabditis brenneri]
MESMRQSSDATINYRQQYTSIRDVRPGALEVNVQSAFAIMVCAEIAHHAYHHTSLDPLGKRIHAKKKTQHKEVPEMYERLREMYDYALAHPEEKDEVKNEIKAPEEPKQNEKAPKETKKPTETVDASKPVEKAADTTIQVDNTQESDPLLEKPSLKEQKTQK